MTAHGEGRRGSSQVEFVLMGVPVIFLIICIFEMSRGMWVYDTLTYATHMVARHIVVRGAGCTSGGNSCGATISTFANDFAYNAIGLDPSVINVTFTSNSGTAVNCNPLNSCYTGTNSTTAWPPSADSSQGSAVQVTANYAFPNALSMLWPGAHSVTFGAVRFTAYSKQTIMF